MKDWFFSLILLSFCSVFIKAFLPKGEKSPLYSSLRFLLATMLVAISFSPIAPIFRKNADWNLQNPFAKAYTSTEETEEELLRRFGLALHEKVSEHFPEEEFSLTITTDENKIPEAIEVFCEKKKTANEIAAFVTENFQIQASVK